MNTFKKLILSAALLIGGVCAMNAQEKNNDRRCSRGQTKQRRGDASFRTGHLPARLQRSVQAVVPHRIESRLPPHRHSTRLQ